ncbi:globoside alpha-1,3-N-acetylgalactosaminyltransferase 1-like isoform X2 [Cynoglossus semilaevis]|uniref:globoside alpha-1,3-N-acetylgalactosaminyltransferase 1-like isoform X1 n=1 Tax=Cynoglossus semilaevis TaxID=244447 RepID=UPI0004970131|nr:globoside alpha-1,3-N-acetylgalactosaminyltransferase 1-like isoform X1 [Cynoglossus semilaevis]XP_008318898.2 globoside alpha-1,3-N-acetylgalactosaminyltransferase 1-like isoform X2 [Cynoglossus semilaevis]
MALFPFCKTSSGAVRVTRIHLVLYSFLLSVIIYFLWGHKAPASGESSHTVFHSLGLKKDGLMTERIIIKADPEWPMETPWGAPLVWGDSQISTWRRAKFAQREIHTGLLTLVVGSYKHFFHRFLSSAETFFLPGQIVTYYILTDTPHSLELPNKLGPERQLKVIPIAELPRWDRLAYRRMSLIADAIRDPISSEVEYIFCADVDQTFLAPVGEEILGDLVATLHPELYGMPRKAFPYETEVASSACVVEEEGDYYYTSELYGGLVAEVFKLARSCSMLITQDQGNGVVARGLEESYLNRYLIDHRPTCVLSPEYSWWESSLTADVPVSRVVSLGRQCSSYDKETRIKHKC